MSDVDLLEKWLQIKLANEGISNKTVLKYRGYLVRLLKFLPGTGFLGATKGQLQEFTGTHLHKLNVAPRSRRVVVSAVRGFYSYLYKSDQVQSDPACELVYPKAPSKLPVAMSLKDTEKLLMAPDISTFTGARDAAILGLFAGCGFRISGLVNLNESDLIYFEFKGKTRLAIKTTEKGDKERSIPVPYEAMMLLNLYLKQPDLKEIDRLLPDGDKVLFVSVGNAKVPADEYRGEHRRFKLRGIQKMMKGHGRDAGINERFLHVHSLRHQMGRELMESDTPLLISQEILGHASANTTKLYTKLAMGKMSESIDKANPLSKITTPVSDLIQEMKQAGHLT